VIAAVICSVFLENRERVERKILRAQKNAFELPIFVLEAGVLEYVKNRGF
jgi:hypothetical protein